MFKRASLSATIAVATLVALPAASQANHAKRDCLGLDRAGAHMTRAADDVGRTVTRVGHDVMRAGDRMLGWLMCKKRGA